MSKTITIVLTLDDNDRIIDVKIEWLPNMRPLAKQRLLNTLWVWFGIMKRNI